MLINKPVPYNCNQNFFLPDLTRWTLSVVFTLSFANNYHASQSQLLKAHLIVYKQ